MPRGKVEVKVPKPAQFHNPEFSNYADKLLQVIKQYYKTIEGRSVDSTQLLEDATYILKERLHD